ncbi:hypothetical protein [Rhodopila sp.]|uniref:hypothetical protein n=1 Tax=Rhodopila sp. TaxID=2480087 RepID=UPI003D0C46E7
MRTKLFPNIVDLVDRWCEITGDDPKEVRQRTREMRREDMLPDFRVSDTRLTEHHVAAFIIAMVAADKHNEAPEAARKRGALHQTDLRSEGGDHSWETTGSLAGDLAFLLRQMKERGPWIVAWLTVSTTHNHADLMAVYGPLKRSARVSADYGAPMLTGKGPKFPVIANRRVEAQVIWHLIGLLSDD